MDVEDRVAEEESGVAAQLSQQRHPCVPERLRNHGHKKSADPVHVEDLIYQRVRM